MNILTDNFYVKFIAFVCLIGCFSLQDTKTPWKHVTKAIEKLDNEGIRSQFIRDLEEIWWWEMLICASCYFLDSVL